MEKLYLKRIALDFSYPGIFIEMKELEEEEKANLKKIYPNHNIRFLKEMMTISDKYLTLAFSISKSAEFESISR